MTSEDAERRRLASVAFGTHGSGEAVHFGCPECGHLIAITASDAGREIACPSCGAGIQAPTVPEGEASQARPAARGGVSRPASLPQRRQDAGGVEGETLESREARVALEERHRLNPALSPKFIPFEGAVPNAYADTDGDWAGGGGSYAAATQKSGKMKFALGILAAMLVAGGIFALVLMTKAAPSDKPITDSNAELSPEVRSLLAFYDEFRAAKSPEDRAPFVRHPEITLPRMLRYYQLRGMDPPSPLLFPHTAEMVTENGVDFIRCDGQFKSETISVWFEKLGGNSFLVDWESLVGFSDTEWDLYLAGSPTGEKEFRVFIRPEEHFVGEYHDSAKFSCAELLHIDSSERLYAYAPRGSEIDKTMAGLIAEAGNRSRRPSACRVRIRFARPGTSGRQVEILAIEPGWVSEEKPPMVDPDLGFEPAPRIEAVPEPEPVAEPLEGSDNELEPDLEEIPRATLPGTNIDEGGRTEIIPSAIPVEPAGGAGGADE